MFTRYAILKFSSSLIFLCLNFLLYFVLLFQWTPNIWKSCPLYSLFLFWLYFYPHFQLSTGAELLFSLTITKPAPNIKDLFENKSHNFSVSEVPRTVPVLQSSDHEKGISRHNVRYFRVKNFFEGKIILQQMIIFTQFSVKCIIYTT